MVYYQDETPLYEKEAKPYLSNPHDRLEIEHC